MILYEYFPYNAYSRLCNVVFFNRSKIFEDLQGSFVYFGAFSLNGLLFDYIKPFAVKFFGSALYGLIRARSKEYS